MEEHKDNTGLIVVIIIGLLLVIGVIAYMFMGDKDTDMIDNNTEETTTTISTSDVAGSYYGTFETSEKSITEEAKDAVEDAADDVKDTITGEEDSDNNDTAYRIELVLNVDGTAKMVNTDKSEKVISGKYTLNNRMITFKENAEEGTDEDTTDDIIFTFTTDDTLTYKYDGITITLTKTTIDLEYIK